MRDIENKFEALLSHMPEEEVEIIIREVKAVALESYRNGQKAGAPKTEKRATATAAPAKKNYKR